jgi:hypothetical protein
LDGVYRTSNRPTDGTEQVVLLSVTCHSGHFTRPVTCTYWRAWSVEPDRFSQDLPVGLTTGPHAAVRRRNANVDPATDTARMATHQMAATEAFDPGACPARSARMDSITGVHG